MSAALDEALVDDVRALLAAFAASGGRRFEARVRPDVSVVMLAHDDAPVGVLIRAPHVATVRWLAAPGTAVAAGDPVATIEVLDDPSDLAAPISGTVGESEAAVGGLTQFGEPLLRLLAQE